MEEKYKQFADNPTLTLLQEWLIINQAITVPKVDKKEYEVIDIDPKKKPSSEQWLRFFFPKEYLKEKSFLRKMWEVCASDFCDGAIDSNYKDALDEFIKQLKHEKDTYREAISKALAKILRRSDIESDDETKFKKYRENELNKLFSDKVFREKIARDFTAYESESDRIAILVVMAMLNLRCREEMPNGCSAYNIDTTIEENRVKVGLYLEDPAMLKDKTSDKRHEKNVEDISQRSNERSDDDDLRFGKNRDGEYNNLKNPDGLYTKDR